MFMTVIMSWCFCADGGGTWGSNPLHPCHCGTERLGRCCSTRWFHASASLCDAGSSSSGEISLLLFVGSDPHRTSELMERLPCKTFKLPCSKLKGAKSGLDCSYIYYMYIYIYTFSDRGIIYNAVHAFGVKYGRKLSTKRRNHLASFKGVSGRSIMRHCLCKMKVYTRSTGILHGVCVQWTPPVKVAVYLYQWDLNNLCCWDPKGNSTLLP